MRPIQARSVPPTDRLLRDVRAARQADIAKGTAPRPTRKPYNDEVASSSPDVAATGDLHSMHSALTSVGDQMLQYHDKVASLATVGHALKQVALKIKPEAPDIGESVAPKPVTKPEIGEDRSGLFGNNEEAE